ncbi:MAG TPA: xylose ABC transporter ATP-binding protein [Bacillota bacterium]|nr:xylose ABC transporter ATP-binding protein [Bacillota bacterium]
MAEYILEMNQITKEFPGVRALKNVSFKVKSGEIHALCGENGAGKSTLMKVLSGVYPFGTYSGQIFIEGRVQRFNSIKDSEEASIAIINQELSVIKQLNIGENIFLGNEPQRYGVIDWPRLYFETGKWLQEVGLNLSPETKVMNLGVGHQQLVEIAKALSRQAHILILDEPTAALTETEVDTLMGILRRLRSNGVTCIYISHKLTEVLEIADSVTVLRDGETIATKAIADTSEADLIAMMVGRELTDRFPRVEHLPGETVLEVNHYNVFEPDYPHRQLVFDASFQVRQGEVLGIAGLMGAGRTELVNSVFGGYLGPHDGEIRINGQPVKITSPFDAYRNGLALVSEDRKRYGLILGQNIQANLTLACLDTFCHYGCINFNEEIKQSQESVASLRIKTPSIETRVNNLSGGNQQKVVLGKCLLTKPKVLILDEPTRGIDVGAKFEIYNIINQLKQNGVAIIMISSELPEILGISDRILVMHEGRFNGEYTAADVNQEIIMAAATGGN